MEYIQFTNGVKIPMRGYGTLHIPAPDAKQCVLKALQCGYRLIDTAASYFNEEEIGEAIIASHIPREEI
ncbi:MAG: aldo/keto reductase, partial [Coprobacillus sp.]